MVPDGRRRDGCRGGRLDSTMRYGDDDSGQRDVQLDACDSAGRNVSLVRRTVAETTVSMVQRFVSNELRATAPLDARTACSHSVGQGDMPAVRGPDVPARLDRVAGPRSLPGVVRDGSVRSSLVADERGTSVPREVGPVQPRRSTARDARGESQSSARRCGVRLWMLESR